MGRSAGNASVADQPPTSGRGVSTMAGHCTRSEAASMPGTAGAAGSAFHASRDGRSPQSGRPSLAHGSVRWRSHLTQPSGARTRQTVGRAQNPPTNRRLLEAASRRGGRRLATCHRRSLPRVLSVSVARRCVGEPGTRPTHLGRSTPRAGWVACAPRGALSPSPLTGLAEGPHLREMCATTSQEGRTRRFSPEPGVQRLGRCIS